VDKPGKIGSFCLLSAPEEGPGESGEDMKRPARGERRMVFHEDETLRDPSFTFDFETERSPDKPPDVPLVDFAGFPTESNSIWFWAMVLLYNRGWSSTCVLEVRTGSASAWEN